MAQHKNDEIVMVLSVCSPVYRAQNILPELVRRIEESVKPLTNDYEIVLVEDCSPDESWRVLSEICAINPRVVGIKLAKNSGQHNAITAALKHAKGNYVVVMDCDLQDDPKYIADMYAEAQKGINIVFTSKINRSHSLWKNVSGQIFGYLLMKLTGNEELYKSNIGSYSLITRKVVNVFLTINDVHRHYIMILRTLGFSHSIVSIKHHKRFEGKSSYVFSKLVNHAIDGIVSQSNRLLYLSVYVGLSMFALSLLLIMVLFVLYYTKGFLSGWTSLMVMILFSTGLIMLIFGIHGLYIGKIFDQVKGRPLYIVEEYINYSEK
jgi:dolichol-phosphate mannosyltransferase